MNLHSNKPLWILFCTVAITFHVVAQVPVTPETALVSYLNNGDKSYRWEVRNTFALGDVKTYDLQLVSQRWRDMTWIHQMFILVPPVVAHDGALLFISGGSVANGEPNRKNKTDGEINTLSQLAIKNKAIIAVLGQVPNQPLFNGLVEDEIISLTLDRFRKEGDYTWPLLFPMVKSAVRAMDALQEFSSKELKKSLNRFVVTGASKRGWTTWLTGAHDKRVVAIAPMVIDMLNMPVQMDYQIKVWKAYSEEINDYVKLGIPQTVHTPSGEAITKMIDPYAYRKKLTLPKMLFMGTNDPYWAVDAVKHYIDSIPGENRIHYVPNVGHDLGDRKQALQALSGFLSYTLAKTPYPLCQWKVSSSTREVTVNVMSTKSALVQANIWSAVSEDQDFRDEHWTSRDLGVNHSSKVIAQQRYPASGYLAFYVELRYKDLNGDVFSETTRMFVTDRDEVFIK